MDLISYYMQNHPLRLIDYYISFGDSDKAIDVARPIIDRYEREGDIRELAELIKFFDDRGLKAKIDLYLPKDSYFINEAREYYSRRFH